MQLLPQAISGDLVFKVRPIAYDASFDMLARDVASVVTEVLRRQEMSAMESAIAATAENQSSHDTR